MNVRNLDPIDAVKSSALNILVFMRSCNCYDSSLEEKLFEFLVNLNSISDEC